MLTRSERLRTPTDLARDIHAAARRLLAGVAIGSSGVRLLGVRMDNLVGVPGAALQDAFDDVEAPEWRGGGCAMDRVQASYGASAAIPGSLVRPPATAATILDLS